MRLITSPTTVLADIAVLLGPVNADAATIQVAVTHRYHLPGANTPPWALLGAARALRAAGVTRLMLDAPQLAAADALDPNGYRVARLPPAGGTPAGMRVAVLPVNETVVSGSPPAADWYLLDATTVGGTPPVVRSQLLAGTDPLALWDAARALLVAPERPMVASLMAHVPREVRWVTHERQVFTSWLLHTPWGRLFRAMQLERASLVVSPR